MHTVLRMPSLSPTMTHGAIGAWHKAEGDRVCAGDVLVEVETDKAVMDFECQEEGWLAKQLVSSGTRDYPVNAPVAVLVETKESVARFAQFTLEDTLISNIPRKDADQEKVPIAAAETRRNTPSMPIEEKLPVKQQRVSPFAKKMAAKAGVEVGSIAGSGSLGRVLARDVEDAAAAACKASTSVADFEHIPLNNVRRTAAIRLLHATQSIPHFHLTSFVDVRSIVDFRRTLDASNRVSLNAFVLKAAALALCDEPVVNSQLECDATGAPLAVRRYASVNIAVAVATLHGLMTPVLRGVHRRTLRDIANAVEEAAERAATRRLVPADFEGATFSVSNLGMFGVASFTAIVSPPQSAVLAVGAVDAATGKMAVTLGCDHRVIDGVDGARWLQAFRAYLEAPLRMLL